MRTVERTSKQDGTATRVAFFQAVDRLTQLAPAHGGDTQIPCNRMHRGPSCRASIEQQLRAGVRLESDFAYYQIEQETQS